MFTKSLLIIASCCIVSKFAIGQPCSPSFTPDYPILATDAFIQSQIDSIYRTSSNLSLGTVAPSTASVNAAIASYNSLNITVSGNTITGATIPNYNSLAFIRVFAQYLKFNSGDAAMALRARNVIWWVAESICNGSLYADLAGYDFRNFSRGAVFCADYLAPAFKQKFLYIMEKNTGNFTHFFVPDYGEAYQLANGSISTDFVYNYMDVLVPLVRWFDIPEQFRYMVTVKRFIIRFCSTNTIGTNDGLKPDGSGYHHWNNYEAYMYAYNTVVTSLRYLSNTIFQVDAPTYLKFRDAVMHKLLISNDANVIPLCMTGRSGDWGGTDFSQGSLSDLAILGGRILGLATADTVLAGIYNRRYGLQTAFNYANVAPFETGFYQMNHGNAGVFRRNNILVVNKGFNNHLWGSEIYPVQNRYGRFQSYGALAVVYPGSAVANGFDNTKWDWNYNPGATTKVLPFSKLLASKSRLDEYSSKRMAGSVQLGLKNKSYLKECYGTYGMFAMDFQELPGQGFGTVTATETHDPTFVFKKSNFFFDDVIICLGSNISNTDANDPTVTTLYQNVTTPANVIVNNSVYSTTGTTTTFSQANNNWVLDNFGTGYLIVAGSGDLKVKRQNQQTPSPTQTDPAVLNTAAPAAIAYIDHGTIPLNKSYEYVVVPGTNSASMQSLATKFQNAGTKPYEVISKTNTAHIIKHKATNIYGLSLFAPHPALVSGTVIRANSDACLIMYQINSTNTQMKLSLARPDLGLSGPRSNEVFPTKVVRITFAGNWRLVTPHPRITLVSSIATSSVYDFATYQGLPIEADFETPTILPISLATFYGYAAPGGNLLTWETLSEVNNKGFEIMHSPTAQKDTWKTIGFVNGSLNSSLKMKYQFLDKINFLKNNYYRLRSVDLDGSFRYSNTLLIKREHSGNTMIYPNPAQTTTTITGVEAGMSVKLLDIAGHTVLEQGVSGVTVTLPLSNLLAGTYMVQVLDRLHKTVNYVKLVKE